MKTANAIPLPAWTKPKEAEFMRALHACPSDSCVVVFRDRGDISVDTLPIAEFPPPVQRRVEAAGGSPFTHWLAVVDYDEHPLGLPFRFYDMVREDRPQA